MPQAIYISLQWFVYFSSLDQAIKKMEEIIQKLKSGQKYSTTFSNYYASTHTSITIVYDPNKAVYVAEEREREAFSAAEHKHKSILKTDEALGAYLEQIK